MSDETAMLIDCLRYRPVAVTAAQMREAADLLAAWEQVWDALNEMGAGLGDANKPLAVTASWALATTERDECKREILALREQVAALESREVCTVAHDNVETCGYCQRDALRKEAARYKDALIDIAGWDCEGPALRVPCNDCRTCIAAAALILTSAAIAKEFPHAP